MRVGLTALLLTLILSTRTCPGAADFSAKASIVNLNKVSLTNPLSTVLYAKDATGIPSFGLNFSLPLFDWRVYHFHWETRVSYTRLTGNSTVQSPDGTETTDFTTLHWVPISTALRLEYWVNGFEHATPSLSVGGGYSWLSSTGNTAGATQNHWVPFMTVSPAITFLSRRSNEDWFGGFTFGPTFQWSVSPKQVLRAWSVDLTFHARL